MLWALLLLLLAGCNDRPTRAPGLAPPTTQPTPQIEKFQLQGTLRFDGGVKFAGSEANFQLLVMGEGLFAIGAADCPGSPEHTPGSAFVKTAATAEGFSFSVPTASLRSTVAAKCGISTLSGAQVAGLRLVATVPADAATCPAFCQGVGTPGTSCVNDCSSGARLLQASRQLTRSEIETLLLPARGGTLTWTQDLVFSALGPPISAGLGPDLLVDGEAARNTAFVSEESVEANSCEISEGCVRGPGLRSLLRFDGAILNLGSSDLFLGDPATNPLFDFDSCHDHFHLHGMMLYELLEAATSQPVLVDGQGLIGRKTGFCMVDIQPEVAGATSNFYDCSYQGLSAGWGDVYDRSLECQYLDVTGVPAGDYLLRLTANPDGVFAESDLSNNSVTVPVRLPRRSSALR